MPKIRPRLESYVVRNTADLVDELSDERREELAEVLHDLEGHSPRAVEAERRTEELVERLEHRNIVLAKSRARIEELERDLAEAKAEIGDREERIAAQVEAERIRSAEREQDFRSELEGREAEIARRLEAFDVRQQEVRHVDSELAERERSLSLREAGDENRARELQALERRSVEAAELESRVALRADAVAKRETQLVAEAELLEQRSARLAELEQQLDHRKNDLARAQGIRTVPFQQ
ncbi:MAG TPA: hypothetical protein VK488_06530 [Gaiellaceae bacterium]|nr:hypothetical protein [Gaiellaceae bacterium]